MEGWKGGRMEGWKGGRVEGWKDGRMEGWKKTYLRLFCSERCEGMPLLSHFSHTVPTVRVFPVVREGGKI
jgi:hypothetical protein